MGQDSTSPTLEIKRALHDFLQGESTDEESNNVPRVPSALPTSFKDGQGTRISRRPIIIIKSSTHNQNLLHFRDETFDFEEEELVAIPILPADEMESLTWEIRLWNSNLRCVRIIFSCGMFSAFALSIITIVFSVHWYLAPTSIQDIPYREGTTDYNIHMCGQIINLLLMFLGSMLFRIMPRAEMRTLIWMHTIIFNLAFGICIVAMLYSIDGHQDFTKSQAHLYSLHSWVGLLGLAFYLACFVSGWIFLYYPSHALRIHHSFYGKVALGLIGMISAMGYYDRSFAYIVKEFGGRNNKQPSKVIAFPLFWMNVIGLLFFTLCVAVRVGLVNFMFKRQPMPQWDVIVFRSIQEIEDIYVEVHDSYDSYELWVKQVNFTKLHVLQAAFLNLDDDINEN